MAQRPGEICTGVAGERGHALGVAGYDEQGADSLGAAMLPSSLGRLARSCM